MKSLATVPLCIMLLLLSGCGLFGDDRFTVPEFEDRTGIAYKPGIRGIEAGKLKELLKASSDLYRLQDRPPGSLGGLKARANSDIDTLLRVLRSEGYYKAAITTEIVETENPPRALLVVETGPAFELASYDIDFTDSPTGAEGLVTTYEQVSLKPDRRARAAKILAAEANILESLEQQGYPLAVIDGRKAFADFETNTLTVRAQATAGPHIRYGSPEVSGLTSVQESHVRKYITLEEGAPYDQRDVDDLRQDLLALGLFETVIIPQPKPPAPDAGTSPVVVKFVEAKHRSVGGGLRYSTDKGPEIRLFWEHRNILGAGERLRFEINGGLEDQELDASFRKPAFGKRERALIASASALHTDNEAFEETGAGLSLGIEEALSDRLRAGGGISLEYSRIKDIKGRRDAYLLGLPLFARYDSSNDLLDPTQGVRSGLFITPYGGTLGGNATLFTVAETKISVYLPLDPKRKFVAAAHGRLGTVFGESLNNIPANKRFYSGGGGSVRGYEFRLIGPLDANGDPTGGRSVAELGAEVRVKITKTIGIVPFVEAGVVSENLFPATGEAIQYAAGLGGRYYSPIGPIRLDVGVPLNPRKRDDRFQVYISLGQAF